MAETILHTLSGTVYDAYNAPMTNVTVQAYDKDLRTTQLLGEVKTDAKGFYTISYDAAKYTDSEYQTADVFIRVIGADKVLLGESPVHFNVPADFVLDFKIDNTPVRGLNEFDALVQKLKPLTEPQKIAFAELQETDKFKDISFLASETGEDPAKIVFLPITFTLFNTTKIAPDIFYGLFRLQFPTDLNALLLVKSESIANGITTAISENIISAKWGAQIDSIVSILNQLAASSMLSDTNDLSKAFKKVIGAALPDQKQQQTFVTVYLANEKIPENFWQVLSKETGFSDPHVIADIQSVLKLNLLTNYQPELTTLLYTEQQKNETLKDIRGFASFSKDDWYSRIEKSELTNFPGGIEGDTLEEKTENYAKALTRLINSLYPTDAFASQLSKDTSGAFEKTKTDLKTFFANNIDYDLKSNKINTLFDESNLTGIKDKKSLKKELVTINRLSKITNEYNQVSALTLDAINSATVLVNKYSATQFAEKFAASMAPETAATIYKNAQQVDNRSTALALSIKMRNDIPIYAINGPANDAPPDYASMFGDTNCDCEHCQSVYSPSAYFVDILNITKQYNLDAFTKLTDRRPDLIQILLTCKNTNTPLPYIDLVNELLENTIAPPVSLQSNQTTNSADELLAYPEHVNTAAYARLKTATSAFNLPLNLPLEETRLYMDKLDVKRYELMELYSGKQTDSNYNDLPIATEYLQLSKIELDIVNGATPMPVALNKVTDFLRDTGLTYIEMLQLLECYFINPLVSGQRSIKIVSTTADQATCKIDDLKLQTTSTQSLKIKPFIRLWKKTGWDILDLDRAFTALGVTDFTGDVNKKLIIPLSHIVRLKAQYNLGVLKSIALWSNIDTAIYHSHAIEGQPKIATQYENLFLNKKVTNPVDVAFSNPGGLTGTLVGKTGVITAALNLSQKDFDTLSKAPFVNGDLTLRNLSVLFRYATLAKSLKMSVDDLISAIDLSGINPFVNTLQSADTLTFIDKITFIRSSGFLLPELSALLKSSIPFSHQIDINNIVKILTSLREGLNKIELLDPEGASSQEQADNKKQIQNRFITDTLGTAFKTESKLIHVLINNLVKSVADNTKPAITSFIEADFVTSLEPLYTINASGILTWTFPDLVNTYILVSDTLSRILKITSKLRISTDEFIYLQNNEAALHITDIWNLPAQNSNLFTAFENLYNFVRFRNALVSPAVEWFTLFDFAILNGVDAKKNFINAFNELSNSTLLSAEYLLGSSSNVIDNGILKYTFPSDYLNGEMLLTVINCANLAAKLGSSVENISKLTMPEPTDAQEIDAAVIAKNILKSKYDVATWLSIIEPLSNQLRVKKRDALVSYILTSPETSLITFRQDHTITDTNSLYACFLIDIEMDACMITSRIKQAISSMQLFIDRCLMNLEAGIVLSTDLTTQWNTWRKRYRVWEANRKIFLYPENWIEPELRDDKSPFFKELESKLRQNEITDETAEDALRFYLEKLDTVSNLEMVGVYPDKLTGIVHAIGRTRNIPHQYYYTKQIEAVWSAWEKIDLDIEGDHILPVVWNNRLMLFWGVFTEKEENSGGFAVPNSGDVIPPATKRLEIKLAWSEYKNGKWGSKRVSKGAIHLISFLRLNVNQVSLSSFIDNEKLYIRVFFDFRVDVNNDFIWNWSDQTFEFNGCHGAPIISPGNSNVGGLKLKIIRRIHGTQLDKMFIQENAGKDSFSVLDNGIYKDYISSSGAAETTLFNNTPGTFQIMPDHSEIEKTKPSTFFYNNERNTFYVHSKDGFKKHIYDDVSILTQGVLINRKAVAPFLTSALADNQTIGIKKTASANFSEVISGLEFVNFPNVPLVFVGKHYAFQTFYHPYVCELIKTLNTSGIDGLYKNAILDTDGVSKDGIQNRAAKDIFIPNGPYNPSPVVQAPYPVEQVDFNYSGVYSIYNWELFFHIPLLLATRLSQNQKFDEARKWFHYIFDPTRSSSSATFNTERFWITKPFKEETRKGILPIEDLINQASTDLEHQLTNWAQNPFKPHAVARLRISAYMRSTVMKYIDNLIAWGDQLFQRDTIEMINEATLLYVLAANMLGKKPERVPARAIPEENSFSTIQNRLDSFGNAKVEIQSYFSLSDYSSTDGSDSSVLMPLFCIPKNDMLLGYWNTVSDRLFKIRHCLNIEGVFRQLPLFEPPIDPALLVRATAAGLDMNSVLNDMNVSLPNYRFHVMLQKAHELCNDVKGLGNELLAALEKKDGEQLSLIRSSHEQKILEAVRDIKVAQRDEAKENLDSLNKSKNVVEARRDYYGSREFINANEAVYFTSVPLAMIYQNMQIGSQSLAAIGYSAPQVTIGPFSSGATYGGDNLGNALTVAAASFGQTANLFNTIGAMANTLGSFQRRKDDWKYQTQSAELELKQVDKQITAAEIRLSITEKDLENHDLLREQSKEMDDYLKSKFTSEELYDHMVEQISSVYFQSYQLAYSTAKKAQKCFEYELGIDNTSFIQFGYWDSLKKGLLSGEKLQYDLRRLESAFLEQNKREYEITKHISIGMLDPLALIQLRSTGTCEFEIPEALYDMDHAGHYFRRIKSVSISLPCIAGPFASVSASLLLKGSRYRKNNNTATEYAESPEGSDERFIYTVGGGQSIATSHAQNDSGVFELNFRDERYLPFEGAGAISGWSLELPSEVRQFDYNTVSDVIIHVKYSAREGGEDLKSKVNLSLKDRLNSVKQQLAQTGLHIAINLKHDLSNEWYLLKKNGMVDVKISKSRLPYMAQSLAATIENVMFVAKVNGNPESFSIHIDDTASTLQRIDEWKLCYGINSEIELDTLFALSAAQPQMDDLEELAMVVKYSF